MNCQSLDEMIQELGNSLDSLAIELLLLLFGIGCILYWLSKRWKKGDRKP